MAYSTKPQANSRTPIRPVFTKRMPKNAGTYFSAQSDVHFQREHPRAYRLLVFLGCTALLLPVVLQIVFTQFVFPAPNSAWLMLGWLGAFLFGAGLFNIVAAWIGQYLGHAVTAVCLLLGAALVAVSCLILYC